MRTATVTILLIITGLFSCSKDTSLNGGGYNPGIMSAYIGGSLWYANTGYVQFPNATAITLYGAYNGQAHISIVIGGYSGPGYYILGGFNTASFYDGNGLDYLATNGSVTITSDNGTQVMGNFQFSGISTVGGYPIYINNGQFNLTR